MRAIVAKRVPADNRHATKSGFGRPNGGCRAGTDARGAVKIVDQPHVASRRRKVPLATSSKVKSPCAASCWKRRRFCVAGRQGRNSELVVDGRVIAIAGTYAPTRVCRPGGRWHEMASEICKHISETNDEPKPKPFDPCHDRGQTSLIGGDHHAGVRVFTSV
jgi:hypothetical protein